MRVTDKNQFYHILPQIQSLLSIRPGNIVLEETFFIFYKKFIHYQENQCNLKYKQEYVGQAT